MSYANSSGVPGDSQVFHYSCARMTGIRSWMADTRPLASLVSSAQEVIGSLSGGDQVGHIPAIASTSSVAWW